MSRPRRHFRSSTIRNNQPPLFVIDSNFRYAGRTPALALALALALGLISGFGNVKTWLLVGGRVGSSNLHLSWQARIRQFDPTNLISSDCERLCACIQQIVDINWKFSMCSSKRSFRTLKH